MNKMTQRGAAGFLLVSEYCCIVKWKRMGRWDKRKEWRN